MSTVGISTFENESPRKYFTLHNEQYLRKFDFSPNWVSLTVGIVCSVEATGSAAVAVGHGLWIGLGSSIANGPSTGFKNRSSVVRMLGGGVGRIGESIYGNSYNAWVYGSNATGSYIGPGFIMSSGITNGSFIGTNGGAPAAPAYFFATAPTGSEAAKKYVSINLQFSQTPSAISVKTNPITSFLGSPNVEGQSHPDSTLFSALTEQGNSYPDINGVDQNQGNSANYAQNSAQPLDTLNIFWTGSVALRIYQIAIARTS